MLYRIALLLSLGFAGAKNLDEYEVQITTPIVGILAQESEILKKIYPNEDLQSYIAASYVKFAESAGGRALPIMIGKDYEYYKDLLDKTNGLILPGGEANINDANGYGDAGRLLFDYAMKRNDAGSYYPIWATCLGMELMPQASINGKEIRASCSAMNVSMPLNFKDDIKTSRIFSGAPDDILHIFATENVTVNLHRFCLTEANFSAYNLDDKWRVLATNLDVNGFEFISSYEHRKYPFYGMQFHAEKNMFEFDTPTTLHTLNAIRTSQYFADFFIEECRKSEVDKECELRDKLIYNYNPRYSFILGDMYQQIYVFTKDD